MQWKIIKESSLLFLVALVMGCTSPGTGEDLAMGTFTLTSSAFSNNGRIPDVYTCKGQDINPPLSLQGIPQGAKSFVLIMDDPDAPMGTWDHWVVWNIPPTTTEIHEGEEPQGVAGKNSWGRTGYGGPCPPSGTHRYVFKLYALDTMLNLKKGETKREVEQAMQGHILAQTQLVGLYSK